MDGVDRRWSGLGVAHAMRCGAGSRWWRRWLGATMGVWFARRLATVVGRRVVGEGEEELAKGGGFGWRLSREGGLVMVERKMPVEELEGEGGVFGEGLVTLWVWLGSRWLVVVGHHFRWPEVWLRLGEDLKEEIEERIRA